MTAVLALCAAIAVFVVVTALDSGGSHGGGHSAAARTPYEAYFARAPHVLSSASLYKLSTPPPRPKFVPLFPSRFQPPVARYRAYSVAQLGVMEQQLPALERALAANDRPAAEAAWRAVYARYLRLGAVYLVGPVSVLNQEIDGTAGGLDGGVASPHFTGLHRIEYGLWSGAAPRTLVGTARRLGVAVQRLRGSLPRRRSPRWNTPPGPTRSSRTPSGICSVERTCPGAGKARSPPTPACKRPRRWSRRYGAAARQEGT